VRPDSAAGPSNSPSAFTKSTFGVDTVALRFYALGGSKTAQALDRTEALRHSRGHLLTTVHDSGARVVWYPDSSMVKIEGRLAALCDGTPQVDRLATRAELRRLPDLAATAIAGMVGEADDELRLSTHRLGRLDTTGELYFAEPADGLAFLRATGALVPPGYKGAPIYRNDGQIETMYVVTAKRGRKVARFYDAGLKHGTDEPGTRIRYEVQNRWDKSTAPTPAALTQEPGALPALYARHLQPFTSHAQEINVTTATDAPSQIAAQLAAGELTQRQATGLAGFVSMLPHGGRHLYTPQSARRYLRELRRHGVVLTASEHEAAMTIGQALDALLDGAYEHSEAQAP
jgi:hypothetical protein